MGNKELARVLLLISRELVSDNEDLDNLSVMKYLARGLGYDLNPRPIRVRGAGSSWSMESNRDYLELFVNFYRNHVEILVYPLGGTSSDLLVSKKFSYQKVGSVSELLNKATEVLRTANSGIKSSSLRISLRVLGRLERQLSDFDLDSSRGKLYSRTLGKAEYNKERKRLMGRLRQIGYQPSKGPLSSGKYFENDDGERIVILGSKMFRGFAYVIETA